MHTNQFKHSLGSIESTAQTLRFEVRVLLWSFPDLFAPPCSFVNIAFVILN